MAGPPQPSASGTSPIGLAPTTHAAAHTFQLASGRLRLHGEIKSFANSAECLHPISKVPTHLALRTQGHGGSGPSGLGFTVIPRTLVQDGQPSSTLTPRNKLVPA